MPEHRTIYSEGYRLAADLFLPEGSGTERRAPVVLLCHGWGGMKAHLSATYAPLFARNGLAALTFDYRGWGESDGKLIPCADTPPLLEAGEVSVRALVIREVVDPLDQLLDIRNALDYLVGEPSIDPGRIGIWGSSYGAGHAIATAAMDARVRCVVGQVGAYSGTLSAEAEVPARARATAKARGELDPPVPQGIDEVPGLRGTPDLAKMVWHQPRLLADRVRVPTLIIDAEREELFDRHENGEAVYEIVRQQAPARYEVYPCTHYEIYDRYFPQAAQLAADWFREYL